MSRPRRVEILILEGALKGKVFTGTAVRVWADDDGNKWIEVNTGDSVRVFPNGWKPGEEGVLSPHNCVYRKGCVEVTFFPDDP